MAAMAGVPGALTNQPPAASNIPETGRWRGRGTGSSGRSRGGRPVTSNWTPIVSHIRRQQGGIRRMTVSVAVGLQGRSRRRGAVTH